MSDSKNFFTILDDGETYSSLRGSLVAHLDEEQFDQYDLGIPLEDLGDVEVFDLSNPADLRALADRLEGKVG